jgi:hypothetical protein
MERLRLKGPDRPCITIGSWWSKVSEKFYTEMGLSETNSVPVARMATIAIEAWVSENMDVMAITNPPKYESFAMPVDVSMFASLLKLPGFDHAMMLSYQAKAKRLRGQAEALDKENTYNGSDPVLLNTRIATQMAIDKMLAEADKLDKLTTLPLGPILMAVQYYEQYAENDFKNWKVIGAENPFGGRNEVLVGEDKNVVVYYHGRPDIVIYEKPTDSLMPVDQKTKDYIDKNVNVVWKPHSQMAGYVFAVQKVARDLGFDRDVDRCLVSVCGRNVRKTPLKKNETAKPRFHRVRPTYSREEIAEWVSTIMKKANRLRFAIENNDIIRNDGFNCHVFFGCDYRRLCAQPAGSREAIKNSDFVQVKPWSPLWEEDDD